MLFNLYLVREKRSLITDCPIDNVKIVLFYDIGITADINCMSSSNAFITCVDILYT